MMSVQKFYHQRSGQSPTGTEVRFERRLVHDEQPYVRELQIGTEWQELDFGWAWPAGFVVVVNRGMKRPWGKPTPEQIALMESLVLVLGIGEKLQHLLVHPSEVQTLTLAAGVLYAKCVGSVPTDVQVTAYKE